MAVFVIETHEFHPDGNRKRIFVETYHPNLVILAADIRLGPVAVEKLFSSRVGDEMVVRDRKDILITAAMIYTAGDADLPFVEYDKSEPEA